MQEQTIDVAVALFTVFFFVAVIASAIVELVGVALSKRSRDLDRVLSGLLGDPASFKATAVYQALAGGTGTKTNGRTPSYIPARSFADAVIEAALTARTAGQSAQQLIDGLADSPVKQRLSTLHAETGGDVTKIKAGLESWFDASMSRLQGAYKRWSSWALLIVGFALAAALNVSATRIADTLWSDSALRAAVVDAAPQIADGPCPQPQTNPEGQGEQVQGDCAPQEKLTAAFGALDELNLPIGWGPDWDDETGAVWTLLGWIPIAFAAKAGAPFWFGMVVRVTGLRGGRGAPTGAADDDASHTRAALSGLTAGTLDTILDNMPAPTTSAPSGATLAPPQVTPDPAPDTNTGQPPVS